MSADGASLASQGCMCSGAGENGDVATITAVDRYEGTKVVFLTCRRTFSSLVQYELRFFSQSLHWFMDLLRLTAGTLFFSPQPTVEIVKIHIPVAPFYIYFFLH